MGIYLSICIVIIILGAIILYKSSDESTIAIIISAILILSGIPSFSIGGLILDNINKPSIQEARYETGIGTDTYYFNQYTKIDKIVTIHGYYKRDNWFTDIKINYHNEQLCLKINGENFKFIDRLPLPPDQEIIKCK